MYKQIERIRKEKGRVKAVLYARCSSDEQRKNGYTIPDQLAYGRHFCRENDIIIVDEYVDEGISATLEIKKRKDLAKMIRDAKSEAHEDFDIVIFKCLDRFFRNVGEFYECQKQLRKANVTWLSIEESDLDPEDDDAVFKINIYLSMSEYEAAKASKRVRFNNQMRIQNKQVITGDQNFIFPWKVVGTKKDRHLERDMDQVERLFGILEHFETFHSKSGTLKWHNERYPKISYQTLSNLLTDTLLYGEYKGVADYVEPSITKERFDKLQDLLKRTTRHPANDADVYLFSGIARCRFCGWGLVGNRCKGGGKHYIYHYRCNNSRRNKICVNNTVLNEKKLEKQLLDNLEQYIQDEIIRVESIAEKKKPEVIDKKKKAEGIRNEMARLNTMYRKGRIDDDEYDKEYAILEADLKKLEAVKEPEKKDVEQLKQLLESDFRTMYAALDKLHKKAFWRNLIKAFTTDENRKIVPESIEFF